ncbi:MAG: YfhO family protein [Paludibacteraceae bacterium]|nr:YfhO family protein [Paludibacteraceae bacterium]
MGLELHANHVQITYYTLFIVLCLGLSELIFTLRERRAEAWKSFGKALGLLVVGAVVAVGLNATRLMTTAEYVKATMRGESTGLTEEGNDQHGLSKDYITAWSYGIDETLTLLIPDFKGGPSAGTLGAGSHTGRAIQKMSGYPEGKPLTSSQQKRLDKQLSNPNFRPRNLHELMYTFNVPLYWGTQPFTAGPVYAGAIICFLFVLGLLLVPARERWWLLGAAVLGIVLSWGKNFMPLTSFFIDYVPLYGKFRTVSMTLTITCLAMALLGMLAVREWFAKGGDSRKRLRALYIAGGVTGGVCLLFCLFPGLAGDFVSTRDASYGAGMEFLRETLPLDRAALLRADAFRSLMLIAAAFGLLWSYERFSKLHAAVFVGGLVLLVSLDMIPVAHRYLNSRHFVDAKLRTAPFKACAADRAVMADQNGQFRVLNLNRDLFNTSEPSYFYKTVGGYSAVKLRRYQDLIEMALIPEIERVSSAMNGAQTQSQFDSVFRSAHILNMLNTRYLVYHDDAAPLLNTQAYGPVWLVSALKVVPDADAEMAALSETDLSQELVIDQSEAGGLAGTYQTEGSSIVQRSYSPNELVYDYEGLSPQLAVFSEVYYYTGWKAYVDGNEVPIRRGNWLLRACELPAGKHEVVLRFHPDSYFNGKIFALISSLLLTFAFLGIIFVRFLAKKRPKEAIV